MPKEKITQKEFRSKVESLARQVHNQYLRMGTFWPMHLCRKEAEKKLKPQYEITKP